jgi:hypothetical protein
MAVAFIVRVPVKLLTAQFEHQPISPKGSLLKRNKKVSALFGLATNFADQQ